MSRGDEMPRPGHKKKKKNTGFGTRGQAMALIQFAKECQQGRVYDEARHEPDRKQ